jgi:hypothetical protein
VNERLEWTPAQAAGAAFLVSELHRLYLARIDYMRAGLGIVEVADAHCLPLPSALYEERGFDRLDAIGEAEKRLRAGIAHDVACSPAPPLEDKPTPGALSL